MDGGDGVGDISELMGDELGSMDMRSMLGE